MRAALPPVSVPTRCSRTWAMLIKRVYEVDPLACPKCGGQMNVVALIEPPQGAVIEKILRHCGLWRPSIPRPPPVGESAEGETGYDIVPSPFGRGVRGEGDSTDWSDADWCFHPADDFAQIGPDDSAYVDIAPFDANEYEPAF